MALKARVTAVQITLVDADRMLTPVEKFVALVIVPAG